LFGKRVALVEKTGKLGGAGINTGTIPSKTLRETALALTGWRSRQLFGVDLSLRRETTIDDFMYHERNVTEHEQKRWDSRLREFGVDIFYATGSFVDPHTVAIAGPDGRSVYLEASKILVATGSSPLRPQEFPFHDDRICDSNQILELQALPKKLAVVGAGVIGCEYACTFAALGTEVHLIDGRRELLPFLDKEISAALSAAMSGSGVMFHWAERVLKPDISRPETITLSLPSDFSNCFFTAHTCGYSVSM
jgi:NAD(P) transhydrogenase